MSEQSPTVVMSKVYWYLAFALLSVSHPISVLGWWNEGKNVFISFNTDYELLKRKFQGYNLDFLTNHNDDNLRWRHIDGPKNLWRLIGRYDNSRPHLRIFFAYVFSELRRKSQAPFVEVEIREHSDLRNRDLGNKLKDSDTCPPLKFLDGKKKDSEQTVSTKDTDSEGFSTVTELTNSDKVVATAELNRREAKEAAERQNTTLDSQESGNTMAQTDADLMREKFERDHVFRIFLQSEVMSKSKSGIPESNPRDLDVLEMEFCHNIGYMFSWRPSSTSRSSKNKRQRVNKAWTYWCKEVLLSSKLLFLDPVQHFEYMFIANQGRLDAEKHWKNAFEDSGKTADLVPNSLPKDWKILIESSLLTARNSISEILMPKKYQ